MKLISLVSFAHATFCLVTISSIFSPFLSALFLSHTSFFFFNLPQMSPSMCWSVCLPYPFLYYSVTFPCMEGFIISVESCSWLLNVLLCTFERRYLSPHTNTLIQKSCHSGGKRLTSACHQVNHPI